MVIVKQTPRRPSEETRWFWEKQQQQQQQLGLGRLFGCGSQRVGAMVIMKQTPRMPVQMTRWFWEQQQQQQNDMKKFNGHRGTSMQKALTAVETSEKKDTKAPKKKKPSTTKKNVHGSSKSTPIIIE